LKSGTLAEYRRHLSCQVLDQFGSKAVASITPRHCEQFLSGLMQRGLAPKTTEHVWSALNRVMKYAMTHGGISSNPAERVDFGGGHAVGDHEKFEHHPPTAEQVGRVAAVVGERYPVYGLRTRVLESAQRGVFRAGGQRPHLHDSTQRGNCGIALNQPSLAQHRSDSQHGHWRGPVHRERAADEDAPRGNLGDERPEVQALAPYRAAATVARGEDARMYRGKPRADEPTAPLWPSRAAGGRRVKGGQAVAPTLWGEPVALGTFYETVVMPAHAAHGLPVSRPAQPARPATETETAPRDASRVRRPTARPTGDVRHHATDVRRPLHAGLAVVWPWIVHVTLDTYGDWIPEVDGGASDQLPEPTAQAPVATGPTTPVTTASAEVATPSKVVQMFGRSAG